MGKIKTEKTRDSTAQLTDGQASALHNADKQSFESFTSGKSKTMDFAAIKRLVISELALNKSIQPQRICGVSRKQILNMCQYPERYGIQILKLMDYIYQIP